MGEPRWQLLFAENERKVEEAVKAEAVRLPPPLERKLFSDRFRSKADPVSFEGAPTLAADCDVLRMATNK